MNKSTGITNYKYKNNLKIYIFIVVIYSISNLSFILSSNTKNKNENKTNKASNSIKINSDYAKYSNSLLQTELEDTIIHEEKNLDPFDKSQKEISKAKLILDNFNKLKENKEHKVK